MQYGYDSAGNMTAMVNGLSALMENVNTGTVPEGATRTRYEYDYLNNMAGSKIRGRLTALYFYRTFLLTPISRDNCSMDT